MLLLLLLSCFSRVLTLCDPIDGGPPGSPVPGILQARTLEWLAISFSNAWKWKWSHSVVSDSSRPHGLQPTRLLCPWDFPGKSTGVGCHCLLHESCIDKSISLLDKFHFSETAAVLKSNFKIDYGYYFLFDNFSEFIYFSSKCWDSWCKYLKVT